MIKFKEILFLKSLKRVGKATIYNKYWDLLVNSSDFDDLVSKVKHNTNFSNEDIDNAINNAQNLHDIVLNDTDIQVITVFDENYPKKLNVMESKRPLILYVNGNENVLKDPNIAVIGTRKPSKDSQEFEVELVKGILNTQNRVIVSGLALGCDKIAHKTTVDLNKTTIAVLPSGINMINPSANRRLAEEIIAAGGCLVSEYEPNTKVFRGNYVERDKIVAALCDAIFVIECGIKSGTMHTVNSAKEYERQIYAYLPEDYSKDAYEGNEFILSSIEDAKSVTDINGFCEDLKNLNSNSKTPVSIQKTLI